MRNTIIVRTAIAAVLIASVVGFRLGAGNWPGLHRSARPAESSAVAAAMPIMAAPSERKILYWKAPDGTSDFSPAPKQAPDGRAYLPVYEDEEADFKSASSPKPKGAGKILYYRNPMGLADTSPVPKKDWMGMDYIAVREGEQQDAGGVTISPGRVQRSGVRTEAAAMRVLARPVRAPGIAKPDERTLRTFTLRADGFIEKLYVNQTGQHVTAGQPLFRVYSPAIVTAQIYYKAAVASAGKGQGDEKGALQRLRNFDIPEQALAEIQANPNPPMAIDWPSPVTGVVMLKNAIEGQMVKAGDEMFRIADLTTMWVIADVAEQDIGVIKVGAPVKIGFRAFPGEVFEGRVAFILHELEMATRTGKVRIDVKNPEHRIKHEMFADVEIDAGAGDGPRLVVPVSAVIDSGNRQVVLVDKGEGRFEPRAVKLGMRGDGLVEILAGLKAGENVVVTANFLIDAESNIKAALQAFTADPAAKLEGKP